MEMGESITVFLIVNKWGYRVFFPFLHSERRNGNRKEAIRAYLHTARLVLHNMILDTMDE